MNKALATLKEMGFDVEVIKDPTKKTISVVKINGDVVTPNMVVPRTQGFLEGFIKAVELLKK